MMCSAGPIGTPEPLSDSERADLVAALDDEYHARATYAQVIADFGAVLPFINIVEAEGRHIEALVRVFDRYGLRVPPDTWPGRVERFASVREACTAGVAAEIENGELFDRLLAGTDRPDIRAVYRSLQEASQERHLEAFRRGAEGGGERTRAGDGWRRRRRRGWQLT